MEETPGPMSHNPRRVQHQALDTNNDPNRWMNDDEKLNRLNLSLTSSGEGGKTKTIQQCLVCVYIYIYCIFIYKTNLTMVQL